MKGDRFSGLDFAIRAAKAIGLDSSKIVGVAKAQLGQRAARPLEAWLSIDRRRLSHLDLRMLGVADSFRAWTADAFREAA